MNQAWLKVAQMLVYYIVVLLIKNMRNSEFQIDVNVCLQGQAQSMTGKRGGATCKELRTIMQIKYRLPTDNRLLCSFGQDIVI